jgi:hypothetical protein
MALVVVLGGCAPGPPAVVEPPAPAYQVQPGTWRAIDARLLNASVYSRGEAAAYARLVMDDWLQRVRRRIDEDFIPWYCSYWTQQWISAKVAWYELHYTEGEASPEQRLVGYLLQQFYAQVLEPVSAFVDPPAVMEHTAVRYLQELQALLDPLPVEYRLPAELFNQHLQAIPAIVVLARPVQDASLYDVLQAGELSALPAYATLLQQIAAVNGSADLPPVPDRLQSVAQRAVHKLLGTLPLRGGATAASTLVGGFWGMLISTGTAAWGVVAHDNDKPGMEAQLRENLDAALEVMWQGLVEDEHAGVMAVVHHMSAHIEHAALHSLRAPLAPDILEPARLF